MKRPRDLLAISVYWFALQFFWTAMLVSVLPDRVGEFAGAAQKGTYLAVITAVGAIVSTLVQLLVGPLSDACSHRWGRRRPFLAAGTLLNTFAIGLFATAHSFAGLILGFAGIQLFLNVATGPYQALIPDLVPPDRHGAASSFMGISQLLGQVSGPLSLLALLKLTGLPAAAALQAVLGIGAALLLLTMGITVLAVRELPAPPEDAVAPGLALRGAFRLGLRGHPDFCWLMGSRFAINLAFYSTVEFLLYYLENTVGLPHKEAQTQDSILVLLSTAGGLLGTIPAGFLADRMPKKWLVYASCGLTAVAATVFTAHPTLGAAQVGACVFGLGFGAFAAVDWALACNLLPEGGKAKYMAIWHFCFTVPQVVAPVIGGPVGDFFNRRGGMGFGWRVVFMMSIVYLIAGTVMITPVRERPVPHATVE